MKRVLTLNLQRHPFHLVEPSFGPINLSFSLFIALVGFVMYLHFGALDSIMIKLIIGPLCVIFGLSFWFGEIIFESKTQKIHSPKVVYGFKSGMVLFIISEVMFFFSFFWSFFYYSVNPSVWIGHTWPPTGLHTVNPWGIPFLNTLLLLSSGIFLTVAHHALILGNKKVAGHGLACTVLLGLIFTGFQAFEYKNTYFCMNDSVYGSIFYLATGFHGFHVLVGTIFLVVCTVRFMLGHFSPTNHFALLAAIWYWHFVDVVWIFLFIFIYLWGSWDSWV